jgi:hypothetical protein
MSTRPRENEGYLFVRHGVTYGWPHRPGGRGRPKGSPRNGWRGGLARSEGHVAPMGYRFTPLPTTRPFVDLLGADLTRCFRLDPWKHANQCLPIANQTTPPPVPVGPEPAAGFCWHQQSRRSSAIGDGTAALRRRRWVVGRGLAAWCGWLRRLRGPRALWRSLSRWCPGTATR